MTHDELVKEVDRIREQYLDGGDRYFEARVKINHLLKYIDRLEKINRESNAIRDGLERRVEKLEGDK